MQRFIYASAIRFALVLSSLLLAILCSVTPPVLAQTFLSGSTGSDGALNLTTPGTIVFDPIALGLDPDGDNIFNFTTINIAAGVTVRLSAAKLTGPVFWLATGAVQINGTIDLSGSPGQESAVIQNNGSRVPAIAGAGGFSGGVGGTADSPPKNGNGKGKGLGTARGGGGAGYATVGGNSQGGGSCAGPLGGGSGAAYGNAFLVPLMAGSGGAGGIVLGAVNGAGGGAGGGALLIASSVSILVNGAMRADGGKGGNSSQFAGGGGSGGAIRLAAPTIGGTGTLHAVGGAGGTGRTACCGYYCSVNNNGHGGTGAWGRIRLEAFNQLFNGSTDPIAPLRSPYGVFLPTTPPSSLVVESVNGTALVNPTGGFSPADIQINTNSPVDVVIRARNIPLTSGNPPSATTVEIHLLSENATDTVTTVSATGGTPENWSVTAHVTFPSGFTRAYVRASWQP